ncbi:MAG: hypothetical protein RJB38_1290 [Pseudomonadota bacterium]|jgi:hypothetical protein
METMKKVIRTMIGIFAALVLSTPGFGTSFIEKSFPDSVGDAPVIVRGQIGMSYSDYGKTLEDGRKLFTFYELNVSEVFKGRSGTGTMIVRQLGGTKEGITVEVPGTAKFSRGEDVVVMLGGENSDGSYDIRSLMMGKYSIEKVDGKEYLRGPGALSPSEVQPGKLIQADEHPTEGPPPLYTLDDLRALVRGDSASGGASRAEPSVHASPNQPVPAGLPSGGARAGSTSENQVLSEEAVNSSPEGDSNFLKWILGAGLIALWVMVRSLRR